MGTCATGVFHPAGADQHGYAANYTERGHEVVVITPTVIEQTAQPDAGKEPAEVLEGIDDARRESRHLTTADIHRGCSAEQGMCGVGGERDQDEKEDRGINSMKLCSKENDARFDPVQHRRHWCATSL